MTFTSIPPSLRPVVEDVARVIFKLPPYEKLCDFEREDTENVILAFLNACVERGVGRAATGALAAEGAFVAVELKEGEYAKKGSFPAMILNLGATDDTA